MSGIIRFYDITRPAAKANRGPPCRCWMVKSCLRRCRRISAFDEIEFCFGRTCL